MNDLNKDILTGTLFFTGISFFISGFFVYSAVTFAATAMLTNIAQPAKS